MIRRASGILLHITSLPSPFGIGDLGPAAYRFADFLAEAKQSLWQVLPLNPTVLARGNSPYSSPSVFAGNPLLISPESLVKDGFLSRSDLRHFPSLPVKIDYPAVLRHKTNLLRIAYQRFGRRDYEFNQFCRDHSNWLEDYALFVALADYLGDVRWRRWPSGIKNRTREEIGKIKRKLWEKTAMEKFLQYLFFKQWFGLKRHCNDRGIQIIGDLPLYAGTDSLDVWANPEMFKLDPKKRPLVVAGIPPDYFSAAGQLWGNPIYRWDTLKEKDYVWWVRRIAHNLKLFDLVRLDHFKGYVDYWEVPAGESTAMNGRWAKGPGADLFKTLLRRFPHLPFIAEDLGVITADVHELRDRFEFPGIRVLQFAFGNDPLAEAYRPAHYVNNCVAYTGTHDNDTLMGWLYGSKDYSTRKPFEIERERKNALKYLGDTDKNGKDLHWEFIRLLMMSAAGLVIIPMQDLLGLGGEARMNRPGRTGGNWEWRLTQDQLTSPWTERLAEMTQTYRRA